MNQKVWKLLFPENVFSQANGKKEALTEFYIKPGQVIHTKFPFNVYSLQDYINHFHTLEKVKHDCYIQVDDSNLTQKQIQSETKYIIYTKIQNSLKNLTLLEIADFWLNLRRVNNCDEPLEVFKKLSLEKWFQYRWVDVPQRIQIVLMLVFMSEPEQFISLMLPRLDISESEEVNLANNIKNIASQRSNSIIIFSSSLTFSDQFQKINYNGFKYVRDKTKYNNDEDNEIEELDEVA